MGSSTMVGESRLSDLDLIRQYKATDDQAILGELYRRYAHLILGTCIKILKNEQDSQDAVNDIFIELIEKLKKFEISNFRSWVYRLTQNHCLMKLRKSGPNEVAIEDNEKFHAAFMENPEFDHLHNEDKPKEEELESALRSLAEEQRKCVEMFFFQKKSYKEIANSTGYELKKVKSYIQNGKRNLKNFLSKERK